MNCSETNSIHSATLKDALIRARGSARIIKAVRIIYERTLQTATFVSMMALGFPAAAQVDHQSASVAALRQVIGQRIGFTVTLEQRPLATQGSHITGLLAQDDTLRAAAVARPLSASVGTVDTVRRCDGRSPRDCRLVGTSMLVAFSDPILSGDSASVYFRIWSYDPSYKRQPVGTKDVRVVLQRVNGRWEVLREDILRQS